MFSLKSRFARWTSFVVSSLILSPRLKSFDKIVNEFLFFGRDVDGS